MLRSLVITPFDASGDRVRDAVQRALRELGVDVLRFDNVSPGASWANAVTDATRSCDFLVVDITRQNPNVFYELGFAHALRKPTILITSSDTSAGLPSALAGFQYIVYDPANLRSLVDGVKRSARAFISSAGED